MKKIIIKPNGGLCNRFRFIFSFIRKLIDEDKLKNTKLIIIWIINEHCPGKIEYFFEKIKNVEFIYNNQYIPDISFSGITENYNNVVYLKKVPLYLQDKLFKKIKKFINCRLNNNYIALHIRRTDLQEILEQNEKRKTRIITDNQYIEYINNNNLKNIYLATDNKKTQEKFKKIFKNRLVIFEDIISEEKIRQTTIEHAIIDLFICGCANRFKGSYYSSYSDFIKLIQEVCKNFKDPTSKLKYFKKL